MSTANIGNPGSIWRKDAPNVWDRWVGSRETPLHHYARTYTDTYAHSTHLSTCNSARNTSCCQCTPALFSIARDESISRSRTHNCLWTNSTPAHKNQHTDLKHTNTQAHKCTKHTCRHIYTHTDTQTFWLTVNERRLTHAHTHKHLYIPTQTSVYTHWLTHKHTYSHTYTHTDTETHARARGLIRNCKIGAVLLTLTKCKCVKTECLPLCMPRLLDADFQICFVRKVKWKNIYKSEYSKTIKISLLNLISVVYNQMKINDNFDTKICYYII